MGLQKQHRQHASVKGKSVAFLFVLILLLFVGFQAKEMACRGRPAMYAGAVSLYTALYLI